MKFEYDEEVDAAYISIDDSIKEGQVKNTIELNENIIVDFDANGKLIGIEILDASSVLTKKALIAAKSS